MSENQKKSQKDVRDAVLKAMIGVMEKHDGLEVVRGGIGVRTTRIPEMLDSAKGFWKDSGDFHKPPRWLFHVVNGTSGPKAVWPSQPSYTSVGVVSAMSARRRKAVLTFRMFPLFKLANGRFEPNLAWEWILWIAMKDTLSPGLGNSAPVQKLSFSKGEVYVRGQREEVIGGGLVGVCDPNDSANFDGFPEPVTYGTISTSLQDLIKGQVEEQKIQVISNTVPEVAKA